MRKWQDCIEVDVLETDTVFRASVPRQDVLAVSEDKGVHSNSHAYLHMSNGHVLIVQGTRDEILRRLQAHA